MPPRERAAVHQEWSRAASGSESEETRRRGKASCRRVSAQPAALPPCTILVPGPCVSRVLSSYPHKTRISLHSFVLVLPAVESGRRGRVSRRVDGAAVRVACTVTESETRRHVIVNRKSHTKSIQNLLIIGL